MTTRVGLIRPLIFLPSDPFGQQIGGIKSFVRDFVRFSPDDFATEFVACSSDIRARPLGRWQTFEIDGRPVRFLPVFSTPDPNRRSRIPISLKFTAAAMLHRRAHGFSQRVLQFNHAGPPMGFLGVDAPKILVVHLNAADIDRGQSESRWSKIPGMLHRLEDVTLPRMDRIFLVNEAGVSFYRERHPNIADRLTFMPTSVDTTTFAPLSREGRLEARRRLVGTLGVADDPRTRFVLFVGRLERQKDPNLLIASFENAQRRHGHLHLVVVGEGGLREEATRSAVARGVSERVHWMGYQERRGLPELMNAADALLLPSAFEGMPITVLEALGCGLPVVATAVGEVPRLVRDGENGRLVRSRSAQELADSLIWVVETPRERFAVAAMEAVAPYQPQRTLEPFYAAHRELHEARWVRAV